MDDDGDDRQPHSPGRPRKFRNDADVVSKLRHKERARKNSIARKMQKKTGKRKKWLA